MTDRTTSPEAIMRVGVGVAMDPEAGRARNLGVVILEPRLETICHAQVSAVVVVGVIQKAFLLPPRCAIGTASIELDDKIHSQ